MARGDAEFVDGVATHEWLMRAPAGLSARERAIVVLRHYGDLSEVDVATEPETSASGPGS
jgi:DNA-directed RNA polymerase specialized sigma24 family protein